MISPVAARFAWPAVSGLFACAVLVLAPQAASAQGHLDARYEATLAGIPVGKGAWTIDIGDDQFSASASGGTAGLLKAFPAVPAPAQPKAASSMAGWFRPIIRRPPRRRTSPRPST